MQLSYCKMSADEINFNDIKSPETPSAVMNYATHRKNEEAAVSIMTMSGLFPAPLSSPPAFLSLHGAFTTCCFYPPASLFIPLAQPAASSQRERVSNVVISDKIF